jgi:hypothetical protein
MAMAGLRFAPLVMLFLPVLALAQPAPGGPETIPPGAVNAFVDSLAVPTHMTGKIARWEKPICAVAVGQQPPVARFVTQHLIAVAAAAGAPVSSDTGCTANVQIVFTTTPQALLDSVRAKDTDYLGYAASTAEREKLAMVTHPIQAWYSTETRDLRGRVTIDSGRDRGVDTAASTARVTGNLISEGLHTGFHHILVVVDLSKLPGQEIVPLSDYIAVLALAQVDSLDGCRQLPSILNLLVRDCARKSDHITENDLAYLSGLYKMDPNRRFATQKSDLAGQMAQTLARH